MHYNGANSHSFVNGQKIVKFRAKDSEIVASPICLGNISKDWSTDNSKWTGFNRYVYEFSVDYKTLNPSNLDKIVPVIHGYFKIKYGMI